MQPRVIQAGALAAASAIAIALAQTVPGAGALALNGALATFSANSICLSQNRTAATPLIINGALKSIAAVAPTSAAALLSVNSTPGTLPDAGLIQTRSIYITSAGNDSAVNWAIIGLDVNNAILKETIKGTNAGVSASITAYRYILSITPSANTASTVTVGAFSPAVMDNMRRVLITSSGTDTGINFTITGTDWSGLPISEVLTGGSSGSPVQSVLDYSTVSSVVASGASAGTVSVGTSGVGGSQWLNLDTWALNNIAGQAVISGTANYTIQSTNDDPDSYGNAVSRSLVTWDSNFMGIIGATASTQFGVSNPPSWMRILLNSGTGTVKVTVVQHGSAFY